MDLSWDLLWALPYLILKSQPIVMPVALCLLNTVFLLLQAGAVDRSLLTGVRRLVVEARQVPELEVPGEGSAGGVDQEVGELSDNVGESHQWEIIQPAPCELSHPAC